MLAAKGQSSAGSKKGAIAASEKDIREWTEEEKDVGMKAFGRGYAGWYVEDQLHHKLFC